MGKPTGFMEFARQDAPKRPAKERIHDYREIEQMLPEEDLRRQAARCMDCGIPYCHAHGCPVENLIPDWNDMVYRGQWRKALELLHATNNFPEITGRVCPAPCETSCTLSINEPAVTIRQIERQIAERGWQEGWTLPQPATHKSGRRAAVIGSGPAGLAAAQQLARRGHEVVVYEKADRVGGILRYGIPDFKLEKWVIDRRLEQMKAEGVFFETKVDAGADISAGYLRRSFDAIVLAAGSRVPRDLTVPGRELKGIHFAMDYLTQQNRRVAGDSIPPGEEITAFKKKVLVIGGGDTGSDCVGNARRQGAMEIHQIEILDQPPDERAGNNPWPNWPLILRTSSSHEEGCRRAWSVTTRDFVGEEGGGEEGPLCQGEVGRREWGLPAAGRLRLRVRDRGGPRPPRHGLRPPRARSPRPGHGARDRRPRQRRRRRGPRHHRAGPLRRRGLRHGRFPRRTLHQPGATRRRGRRPLSPQQMTGS